MRLAGLDAHVTIRGQLSDVVGATDHVAFRG
ncbi:hypothetical protein HD598_001618 [Neomicrococcus aestuarii]|uniref:Uncharacterized protein n=1 Tax=Neomicrococcus aestuarii TaxID=556325 RepID=A0A7W8WZ34_9MICC|nr:hypothetical protein [Neomicrococcus aestuarii]